MQAVILYYKDEGMKFERIEFLPLTKHTREEIHDKAAEYNAKNGVCKVKIIDDPLIEAAFNYIRPLDPPYRQPKDLIDDIEGVRNELSNSVAGITADLDLILDRLNETPTQEATK